MIYYPCLPGKLFLSLPTKTHVMHPTAKSHWYPFPEAFGIVKEDINKRKRHILTASLLAVPCLCFPTPIPGSALFTRRWEYSKTWLLSMNWLAMQWNPRPIPSTRLRGVLFARVWVTSCTSWAPWSSRWGDGGEGRQVTFMPNRVKRGNVVAARWSLRC